MSASIAQVFRSSILAFYLMALLYLVVIALVFWCAFGVLPKGSTRPPVSDVAANQDWTGLERFEGERLAGSRLLGDSAVSTELRGLLGEDYAPWVDAMGAETMIRRTGPLLVLVHDNGDGTDAAYLIVHPQSRRLEAGLRRDGQLTVRRTPGAPLTRPANVQRIAGGEGSGDTMLYPFTPACILRSGPAGLHLSGRLVPNQACKFLLTVRAGQTIALQNGAPGIDVRLGSAPVLPGHILRVGNSGVGMLSVSRGTGRRGSTGTAAFAFDLRVQ